MTKLKFFHGSTFLCSLLLFSVLSRMCSRQLAHCWPPPPWQVVSIMWQLLWAVRYLHDNNVWHRDIKTANVLIKLSEGAR